MAPLSWDEVQSIMQQRRQADSTLMRQMQDVTNRYEGTVAIPLADVEGEPAMSYPTPNLIADVIETTSMRSASTTPIISCPVLGNTKTATDRAQTRRKALYAAWDYSSLMETILPRAYRHLYGYGTHSLVVMPDFEAKRARIEVRDPLTNYPEFRSPEDTREPRNNGAIYGRSVEWLMAKYPESRDFFTSVVKNIRSHRAEQVVRQTLWDVVEWVDEDQVMIGILGPREDNAVFTGVPASSLGLHLRTWDNRAGMVPIACGRRVTLRSIEGQVSKLTGLGDMMGKLMALDVLAAEKAVFADMVVLGKDKTPQLLNASGRWNDGRTGEANIVQADAVQMLQGAPGPITHSVVDRLEGYFRQSGGLSQMALGQNTNGLRTGNALEQMAGIHLDPRMIEGQRLMARSLKIVNEAVCEIEKGYFPNRKAVFFSGWAGDKGHVTYTPAIDFDSRENAVSYAFPGSDVNQLTVAIGQAVGADLISKKTGRSKHPLVDDPETEEIEITKQKIEEAAMVSFIQQAQAGVLPLIDLASIYTEYEKTGSWIKAVVEAHKQSQERQATPAAPTAPEAMPGLGVPGDGGASMVADAGQQIPGPQAASQDFRSLVHALTTPSTASAPPQLAAR